MDTRTLIHLQLELECIGLDASGLLVRIPGPDPDDIGRLYVYRHADGHTRFVRHDVPAGIRERLLALPSETAFDDPPTIQRLLGQPNSGEDHGFGTSYVVGSPPKPAEYADTVRLGETDRALIERFDPGFAARLPGPIFAIVVDGRVVSACVSARENDRAAEAWVQTLPGFRRRGYARQVTAAWADDALMQGKTAFYSHRRENLASRAVAWSLGLSKFVDYANYQ